MLLILLLISWSHFLDLTAKFMSFLGFQIQTDQANYLPNNSSFFHFLPYHNRRVTQVGYFTALLCTDNAVKRGFPSVYLCNG